MNKKQKAFALFGALAIIMATFFIFIAAPSMAGKEVILPLQPVDPFDPLRGQYLTLSYLINRPSGIGLDNLTQGQSVYLLLKSNASGISNPVQASTSPLSSATDQIMIKGHYENGMIYYGIEAYFMERGARLDTPISEAMAKIKILPDGRASVTELQKDGKKLEFTLKEGTFLQR